MRIFSLLGLSLLAAACQPAMAPAGVGAAPPALTLAELPGAYRVVAVNGAPAEQPEAMLVTITDSRIDVQSGCIRFAYEYRTDRAALTTGPVPAPSCRRALMPAEQAVQQTFAAAAQVARMPAGGLEFTGAGRSVTLSRQ